MRNLFKFTILLSSLILSTNIFADVKVKIRQTISGQTNENTTYIKGKRQRAEQNIGSTQMVTITQCDLKRSLQLMPVTQTYMINSWEQTANVRSTTTTKTVSKTTEKGGVVTTTITIKDTGERKEMFGYTARHLIITMDTQSSPDACQKTKSKIETDGWYIDAAFALDCDNDNYTTNHYSNNQNGGCQDRYESKQVGTGKRGYPVYEKMTMFDENGKESFTITNEVLEFSKATLEDSLFEIPQGYREVKSAAEMYSTAGYTNSSTTTTNSSNSKGYDAPVNTGFNQTLGNLAKSNDVTPVEPGAKKEGMIRIGIVAKTSAVGENLNSEQLSDAIENTFFEYLKGTKVEVIELESKLPSAIVEEAKSRECDYVIFANVSHKKGGGGFGVFGKTLGNVVAQTGIGHTGSVAGNIAGQVATQAIVAATLSANIKSKDEVTLDIKLQSSTDTSSPFAKQYKAKAKTDGEDIISPMIEQAAQSIIDAVGK